MENGVNVKGEENVGLFLQERRAWLFVFEKPGTGDGRGADCGWKMVIMVCEGAGKHVRTGFLCWGRREKKSRGEICACLSGPTGPFVRSAVHNGSSKKKKRSSVLLAWQEKCLKVDLCPSHRFK